MSKSEKELRYVQAPSEVRMIEEGESRRVEGYAALYDTRTTIGNWFEEEIAPGAFDDVLGDDVRALFNHDPNMILARSKDGKGTLTLSVDERGLKYAFDMPDRTYARDLFDAIKSGDVDSSSFGFRIEQEEWEERGDGELPVRRITRMAQLYDVSPVTYPAYPDATVALRSMPQDKNEEPTTNSTLSWRAAQMKINNLK